MLVAATLADKTGNIFLAGATGHNYDNTAELNVMNYKQAMDTVDKEEWNKVIKVGHDKTVKYKKSSMEEIYLQEPSCLIPRG